MNNYSGGTKVIIHIVSGFLGAGKTSFINKWLPLLEGKVCLIENEFGEICIDSAYFDQEIQIKEIYAGCICCSLVGDFRNGIMELYKRYTPDHLIIEPSGVSNLSDVIEVCNRIMDENKKEISIGSIVTLVEYDAFLDYEAHFGNFYTDQIKHTSMVLLSHLAERVATDLDEVVTRIGQLNCEAFIVKEDWMPLNEMVFKHYIELAGQMKIKAGNDIDILPADKVLESLSIASPKRISESSFMKMFLALPTYASGRLLRAKGFVPIDNNRQIQFNFTPFSQDWSYVDENKTLGVTFIGVELNKKI